MSMLIEIFYLLIIDCSCIWISKAAHFFPSHSILSPTKTKQHISQWPELLRFHHTSNHLMIDYMSRMSTFAQLDSIVETPKASWRSIWKSISSNDYQSRLRHVFYTLAIDKLVRHDVIFWHAATTNYAWTKGVFVRIYKSIAVRLSKSPFIIKYIVPYHTLVRYISPAHFAKCSMRIDANNDKWQSWMATWCNWT